MQFVARRPAPPRAGGMLAVDVEPVEAVTPQVEHRRASEPGADRARWSVVGCKEEVHPECGQGWTDCEDIVSVCDESNFRVNRERSNRGGFQAEVSSEKPLRQPRISSNMPV